MPHAPRCVVRFLFLAPTPPSPRLLAAPLHGASFRVLFVAFGFGPLEFMDFDRERGSVMVI